MIINNIALIIQARLGSTRLPNKILLPFYKEKSILDLLVERIKTIDNANIILATTNSDRDIPLIEKAEKANIHCFRGSENDVLQRFIDTAEYFGYRKLIRICSDNPFLDVNSLKYLIDQANHSDYDYISFCVNNTPSIKTHFGFWSEYVTIDSLKQVREQTSESLYHEHVTNYIYTHPDIFKIKWLETPDCLSQRNDIRLTIDTESDFVNAQNIYSEIYSKIDDPKIEDIVSYLDTHLEYLSIMKQEIYKNSK